MAIETHTSVPTIIRAGDTIKWTVSFADYPASTWSLRHFFTREGAGTVEIAGVASSDAYVFTMTPEDSGQMTDGRWDWFSRAEKQDEGAIVADTGCTDVLPDPAAKHKRTFSEEALEMVERSLRGDMPTAQESYSLSGLDVTKMSISERFTLRDKIKAEIVRERNRRRLNAGLDNRQGIQVRFI